MNEIPGGLTEQQGPTEHSTNSMLNKQRKDTQMKVGKKQGIKVASLNINGRMTDKKESKIKMLAALMRQERIAILAVQETHLNETLTEKVNTENKSIIIMNNGYTTNKEGVAFIINKRELNLEVASCTHEILIDGRASRLIVNWGTENELDIINVYLPNEVQAKVEMIKKITEIMNTKNVKNPILMGDWNFVEEGIDRSPIHEDDNRIKDTFRTLKEKYKLIDGWRMDNEKSVQFTFTARDTGSLSRIDRIYTAKETYLYAMNWTIHPTGNLSDHEMTVVEILKEGLPYIGKGIKTFPLNILEYQPFVKECVVMLYKRQQQILNDEVNAQHTWDKLQTEILDLATRMKKRRLKELDKEYKDKQNRVKVALQELNEAYNNRTRANNQTVNEAMKELNKARRERLDAMGLRTKARFELNVEKMNKYWFRSQKELPGAKHKREPRATPGGEVIRALFNDKNEIVTETRKMKDIASNYHRELQKEQTMTPEREEAIEELLKDVTVKLDDREYTLMGAPIRESEVRDALNGSENGKSPGITGIQYEFWKFFEQLRKKSLKNKNEPTTDYETALKELNIVNVMAHVYDNMKNNGIKSSTFTEGVMCLIYKKKDRRRIENYRPITLLNTDYKLLTKVLANRLAKVVDTVVHENQAGFCPGRSIYDSTRLTTTIIDYCEQTGKNGCIVALDQEKAYDKIAHDYLWRVLEHMNFPETFTNMIKELYKNAKTRVMVNGVVPTPIEIMRGVRQGDPMSCLLYDLAIEPLAQKLRSSNLKGFDIPGVKDKVLASLFADDTLIYLSEEDDITELRKIIETFCTASTAKFNLEKTEYLPIGKPEHRLRVFNERKLNNKPGNEVEEGLRIVKDGESMRTLGAWVGNKVDVHPQWESILDRQRRVMEVWNDARLSHGGKELILKILVQSLALYLATVNGMPKDVETRMTRQMRSFLWDGKKNGYMRWDEVIAPKEQGGLNVPDIKLRNEAIEIMWLKRYLKGERRPIWAYIADQLIFKNIPPKPMIDTEARISWILQKWNEYASSVGTIPKYLRKMLKIGRKYNVGLDTLKVDKELKKDMVIWHHPAILNNYYWNKKTSKCLRKNHHIYKVGEIEDFVMRPRMRTHCNHTSKCVRMARTLLALLPNKYNPQSTTPHKDNLDHTRRRIEKYMKRDIMEKAVAFNPDITARGNIYEHVRIFKTNKTYKCRKTIDKTMTIEPAYRRGHNETSEKRLTLYTDGSCKNNVGGIGVWRKLNSKYNRSLRIPPGEQTSPRAEILALIAAVQAAENRKLAIRTDSLTSAKALTKELKGWEDKDFIGVKNDKEWRLLAYLLRRRPAKTTIKWIQGHSGIFGNEMADLLAEQGRSENEWNLDYNIPEEWKVDGARLQAINQKIAYKLLIRNKAKKPGHRNERTRLNVEYAQDELERTTGIRPTEELVWKGIYKRPIQRKKSDFIWKLIHDRLRCGKYFKYIPGAEEKQYCKCGEIENPEHILFECETTQVLWERIEKLWKQTSKVKWIKPNRGIIHGLGAIRLTNDKGVEKSADTYYYKAIIVEAIWEIWKYRNKIVFDNIQSSKEELYQRWNKSLVQTITNEYEMIKLIPYERRKEASEKFKGRWIRKGVARIEQIKEGSEKLVIEL